MNRALSNVTPVSIHVSEEIFASTTWSKNMTSKGGTRKQSGCIWLPSLLLYVENGVEIYLRNVDLL
jgi:hypothetical protein